MYEVYSAEITEWCEQHKGEKYHAILSDFPYGLAFMGKDWDDIGIGAQFQSVVKSWGEALLPMLYPGDICLAFGGTRTWHRLASGMEDAGFELWDTIMWLHGQGFPKGQAIDKLIDKSQGNEREVLGVTKGAATNNTECRGDYASTYNITEPSKESAPWSGHKTAALKPAWEPVLCFKVPSEGKTYAELALEFGSGALNVDGGRIGTEVKGWVVHPSLGYSGGLDSEESARPVVGRYPANLILDKESSVLLDEQAGKSVHGAGKERKGGPSRFYYCAKASTSERKAGCKSRNNHPCCKPVDLCRYLALLLLPPDSVKERSILVPFSGSGSEMIGCIKAGWDKVVGIEKDKHFCSIARQRLKHHDKKPAKTPKRNNQKQVIVSPRPIHG